MALSLARLRPAAATPGSVPVPPDYWSQPTEKLLTALGSSPQGLSTAEVAKRWFFAWNDRRANAER
ncbi:MAG: hypothetical protein MUD01_01300 [Chloroflexaceae bacterium]|jgi:hypothetical protein|nr:hypothetical protein [Chloroflexaceae bacterium]